MPKRENLQRIDNLSRRQIIGVAAYGGGGGGAAATAAHALYGPSHTGQLDPTQAPWATTDTEFLAHTSNPDAHHPKQHDILGADHTITAPALSLIGTTSDNVLGLLTTTADGNANRERVLRTDAGGALTVTTLTGVTEVKTPKLNAVGNLLIDPVGDVVFPVAQNLRSEVFDSSFPIAGWKIYPTAIAGQSGLTIGVVSADEIRTRVFVADETRIDRGEEIVGKSYGILNADFVTPAIGGSGVETWWDNSPAIAGGIFSDGDWLAFRIFEDASGFSITTLWCQVYLSTSGGVQGYFLDTVNRRQRWRLVLRQGTTGFTVRKGLTVWDWGLSGQGVIISNAIDPTGAPYIKIATWSGSDPYSPANRTTRTQIGNLGGITSSVLAPTGWGLYSDNAFLEGDMVVAGGNVKILKNSGINIREDVGAFWDTSQRALRWWPDLASMTGQPSLSILTSKITSSPPVNQNASWVKAYPTGGVWAQLTLEALGQGGANHGSVYLTGGSSVAGFPSQVIITADSLRLAGPLSVDTVTLNGSLLRNAAAGTYNIGSSGSPFSNLYVNTIVAGTVTSTTALGGQIWQYDTGDMYIRSSSTSSRTLYVANPNTGSMHLDVEGSITVGGTVDGVDVSTLNSSFSSLLSSYNSHAADTNIHHNKAHVLATTTALGADHTVSGLTVGMTLRATGATTARFELLNHIDLAGVSPDQHHAKVHVLATNAGLGADHTISGATAGHALVATSATAAQFQAVNHANIANVLPDQHHPRRHDMLSSSDHAYTGGAALDLFGLSAANTPALITPSSNPGAATRVLKSDSNGSLTLQGLTTNVDATVGQSLYAGGSNLRVLYHSTPSPHVHLVVNPTVGWNLDEQFGVDIDDNLLVRGWIVGKHAIQLSGAQMICHFDGPEPYLTNTKGETTGHMGQVGTAGSGLIFRPGKYGKGIQAAEATTNLITNPSFEADATGWANYSTGSPVGTRARVTNRFAYGGASYKLSKTGGGNGDDYGISTTFPVTIGQPYTASAWVYVESLAGTTPTFSLNIQGGVPSTTISQTATTAGWVRLSVTATATATGTATLYLFFQTGTGVVYVDAVQVENKSYVTPYCDGTLGAGHVWTGLAHGSTSTRATGNLYYAGSNINLQTGSILLWANFDERHSADQCLFGIGNSNTNRFYVSWFAANNFYVNYQSDATTHIIADATAPASGWHHVAVTWSPSILSFYVDGLLVGTTAMPTAVITGATNLYVGSYHDGSYANWNGVIDEFVLCDREVTEDEVRAIYESNAPVFGETSTWQWRAANNLVWTDSEGLWMVDAAGNSVLGASGVNGKGWGGLTLSAGDVLIGSTAKGYVFFDADQASMNLVLADVTSQFARLDSVNGLSLRLTGGGAFENKAALGWWVDPGSQIGEAPVYTQARTPDATEYQLITKVGKPAGGTSYGRFIAQADGNDISSNRAQASLELMGSNNSNQSSAYLFAHRLYLGQGNGTAAGNIVELWGQGLGVNRTPSASYALDVNGAAHASSFPTSSDERLKDVQGRIDRVLDKLSEIGAYRFAWKSGYEGYSQFLDRAGQPLPQIGFLAQEVERQFPETISYWQHAGGIALDDARAVDYGRLVPVLVAAINELAGKIESLTKGE